MDAGKKRKDRKRHITVDTQGWLLAAMVYSPSIQDRAGTRAGLMRLFAAFSTLTTVFHGGYTGKLIDWIKERWIVERTFAWRNHLRGLTQAHAVLPHTSKTFITITMTYLTLPRLA
jgi:hypothetical protein